MAPRERMLGGVGLQGECDHVGYETLLGQNVDFVRHALGSGVIHLGLGFAGPFLVLLKPNLEVMDGAQVFIEFLSVPGPRSLRGPWRHQGPHSKRPSLLQLLDLSFDFLLGSLSEQLLIKLDGEVMAVEPLRWPSRRATGSWSPRSKKERVAAPICRAINWSREGVLESGQARSLGRSQPSHFGGMPVVAVLTGMRKPGKRVRSFTCSLSSFRYGVVARIGPDFSERERGHETQAGVHRDETLGR